MEMGGIFFWKGGADRNTGVPKDPDFEVLSEADWETARWTAPSPFVPKRWILLLPGS